MHNFCNLINAANILESPSAAGATDVQFASRAGPVSAARSPHGAGCESSPKPCHFSTSEKCSGWEGDRCEHAEAGNASRTWPKSAVRIRRSDFSTSPALRSHGCVRDLQLGRGFPRKDQSLCTMGVAPATPPRAHLRGELGRSQSQQVSFALRRNLGLCPRWFLCREQRHSSCCSPRWHWAGSRALHIQHSPTEVNVTEPAAFLPSPVFFKDNLLDENTFFSLGKKKNTKKQHKKANSFSPPAVRARAHTWRAACVRGEQGSCQAEAFSREQSRALPLQKM